MGPPEYILTKLVINIYFCIISFIQIKKKIRTCFRNLFFKIKIKKQHGWILRGTDKDERYEQKYIYMNMASILFVADDWKKNSKLLFIHSASYIQILFIGSNFTIILALLQIGISDMTVLKKEIWPPPTPFNFSILWINHFKYRST